MGIRSGDGTNLDDIIAELAADFLDSLRDRLDKLEEFRNAAAKRPDQAADAFHNFRREVHSLKGSAGSVGFPTISMLCHQFEDYLSRVPTEDFSGDLSISAYVDVLDEILNDRTEPDPGEAMALLRSLPRSPQTEKARRLSTQPEPDLEGLVVVKSSPIRHKIRDDLSRMGFKVSTMISGMEAVYRAVHVQPEVIIVSGTVDQMDGFDLVRALKSMHATRNLGVIALTSHGPDHPDVLSLQGVVPVIHLGQDLSLQLTSALTELDCFKARETV